MVLDAKKIETMKHTMFENNSNTNVKYCIHIYILDQMCKMLIIYIPFIFT